VGVSSVTAQPETMSHKASKNINGVFVIIQANFSKGM
jgi:hypothetical protein